MSRWPALVGVRPGEARSVALMLGHSFAMGLATVFFETAASALFLARFGPEVLPWVYVVAAGLTALTGTAFAAVKERVSFAQLMLGTLAFLLVSVLLLRGGLALVAAGPLLFGLLVWYRVVSILTDLEYWAVAARLYDLRQAKRLFGLIGSGPSRCRCYCASSRFRACSCCRPRRSPSASCCWRVSCRSCPRPCRRACREPVAPTWRPRTRATACARSGAIPT
jgi:hypothetical protein